MSKKIYLLLTLIIMGCSTAKNTDKSNNVSTPANSSTDNKYMSPKEEIKTNTQKAIKESLRKPIVIKRTRDSI